MVESSVSPLVGESRAENMATGYKEERCPGYPGRVTRVDICRATNRRGTVRVSLGVLAFNILSGAVRRRRADVVVYLHTYKPNPKNPYPTIVSMSVDYSLAFNAANVHCCCSHFLYFLFIIHLRPLVEEPSRVSLMLLALHRFLYAFCTHGVSFAFA